MRSFALALAAAVAIFSGCRNDGIRGYWSSHPVSIEDYAAAEDQFAEFAELAAKAPRKDAFAALDMLLKKAAEDEVTYYVYTDFIARAFSLLASPCFDCELFRHAADKVIAKGILSPYSTQEYESKLRICLHNRLGDKVLLPEVWQSDGTDVDIPLTQRTLFLVVDQDCSSCRASMGRLSGPEWADTWLVALCYGHGPLPDVPGWDCFRIGGDQDVLDVRQGPFYFVSSEDGIIEKGYTTI
ncbi:MAG: hypothetical protein II720_07830 [Bacteroidales bacterium]|nr:hypothetical protein [Bacteroidales bacterium]